MTTVVTKGTSQEEQILSQVTICDNGEKSRGTPRQHRYSMEVES